MFVSSSVHSHFSIRVLLSVVIGAISLTMLAPYSIEFTRATSAAVQMFSLIDRKSAIDPFDRSGDQPIDTVGLLELENVTFAYPTRPGTTVLDGFSLKAPAGKVTALVVSISSIIKRFMDDLRIIKGQSGSGKSTIVGLIERWYDPSSGTIKLDGRPIGQLNLNWLRKNVRLVQQVRGFLLGAVLDVVNIILGTCPISRIGIC
jgi:ATP-binding cassette, subfamily B (MDR/TAP), member 1